MIDKIDSHQLEKLTGRIERVAFHNEDNGFCVLGVRVKERANPITVIGKSIRVAPGESIECFGSWINDKTYGLQFKAEQLKITLPTSIEGIEKYLSSGLIRGVGSHFAKILIETFGERVFSILDDEPDSLLKIPGIGKKKQAMILSSWREQRAISKIMIFLQEHGIGTARSVRIYKTYGDASIEKIKENPYRLSLDIYGIGFKIADALAMRLGIASDSLRRAEAGIRHILQEFAENGHCAIEQQRLIKNSAILLGVSEEKITQAIANELSEARIVKDIIAGKDHIFLIALYHAEEKTARNILRLLKGQPLWGELNVEKALFWVEQRTGIKLSPSQKEALVLALKEKVLIITGGPGVGKTTIVNSILKIICTKTTSIALCAPTGRAAKRLSETTHHTAKTIHRLLEFNPRQRRFMRHQNRPLEADLVIIDEASMIDIVLMYSLLRAIPDHASLIIVGDVDQLPSVGPGRVLADLIATKKIPTVHLLEIFRQAATSQIVVNAHRVNKGEIPLCSQESSELNDFYIISAKDAEDIQDKLLYLLTDRIPKRFGFHPLRDIQVLTPMNRGALGSHALNFVLQRELNANSEPKISLFGRDFAPGDKVIQIVNNYDKDVFNGDIGCIDHVDLEKRLVKINFDHRFVDYCYDELDEISLAYATSIHKSQGSEYPAVVIPIATQHYLLLARNLLYTAITRGRKLVVLIGQMKAIIMAVKNVNRETRVTKLAERLIN